jgi:hypothetical protein
MPAAPFIDLARVRRLRTFAETSARHLARDGLLVAMKGVHPDEVAGCPPTSP